MKCIHYFSLWSWLELLFVFSIIDFAASQFRQYERLTKQMKPSEVGDEYERTKQRM